MGYQLEDKVVIITGAGSGLGQATAVRLAEEGAKLTLVDLNEEGLKATEDLIKASKPETEVISIIANVADEAQVINYVNETVNKYGRIDGFFNNAGVEGKQNLTENFGKEEFDRVLSVNLDGAFYGLMQVLKVMHKQGSGSIVNCASVGGIRGVGNQAAYSASKHGVVGLTKNAAVEYGEMGININAIAPGAIMTAMVEGSLKQMDPVNWEEAGKQFVQANPTKRFGHVNEISGVVAFLLSEDASFINGQTIAIDGGQSIKY